MDRQSVTSSNIRSVGYDPATDTLEIEFHGGRIYQYDGVPENVYRGLMAAPSHGSHFQANVRNTYPFRKIA